MDVNDILVLVFVRQDFPVHEENGDRFRFRFDQE